jgi:hypothetical protein
MVTADGNGDTVAGESSDEMSTSRSGGSDAVTDAALAIASTEHGDGRALATSEFHACHQGLYRLVGNRIRCSRAGRSVSQADVDRIVIAAAEEALDNGSAWIEALGFDAVLWVRASRAFGRVVPPARPHHVRHSGMGAVVSLAQALGRPLTDEETVRAANGAVEARLRSRRGR